MTDLNLRIFAHVEDPSSDPDGGTGLLDYLVKKEGVMDPSDVWVDIAIARNYEWTEEILEKTTAYGLVDDEGNILAQFDTLPEAETAKSKARAKLKLVFEMDEDEAPAKAPKASKPEKIEISTDSQTGQSSVVTEALAGLA